MTRLLSLRSFYLSHPVELLWHFALLLAGLWVLGAVLFAMCRAYLEHRDRQRFDRIMQASTPPPKAPGFHSRRIS